MVYRIPTANLKGGKGEPGGSDAATAEWVKTGPLTSAALEDVYGKSAANFAALPAAGEFPGHRIWLVDIKGFALWTGAAWVVDKPRTGQVIQTPPASATTSYSVTFSPAFPTGVTPRVTLGLEANLDWIYAGKLDVTNVGFTLRLRNAYTSTIGTATVDYIAVAP
ncbi:MAG: H-type lectin domain-containing protein [Mycetocola sp.]